MGMHVSDAGGTGDPTETLEVDWSYSPQTCREHYMQALTWNPEGQGKEDDLETLGTTIWKRASKQLVTPGDGWRDWLRT